MDIDKELESCTKGSEKYIELSKRKSKVLRQDKNARIAMLKAKYKKTLDIFESPMHLVFLQKDTRSLDSIIKQIKAKNFYIDEMVFEKLKSLGLELEEREFVPHITLARKFKPGENFPFEETGKFLPEKAVFANRISLMKSERIDGVLRYTEIYSKKLL